VVVGPSPLEDAAARRTGAVLTRKVLAPSRYLYSARS
jgi:hypothetical protein